MPRDVKLADLVAANPNFEQQMRDWQTERHQKGEDPLDWQPFRELQTYIGAPDPGEDAPAEFYWFTPPAAADAGPTAAADASFGAGAAEAFSGSGTPEAANATATVAADPTQMADVASTGTAEPAPREKSWAERWDAEPKSS